MVERTVDELVIELTKSLKIPIEGIYASKRAGELLEPTDAQMFCGDDEGFPIADYFIIGKGHINQRENRRGLLCFNRYLELAVYMLAKKDINLSSHFEIGLNWDVFRADGFEKIYPKD